VNLWLVIALAGAGTFAMRLSWLVLLRPDAMPRAAREALRFVMPAVLAAIILPAVLYTTDSGDLSIDALSNERIPAAVIAAIVAWGTRNTWVTIGAGMVALWAIKAIT
jgi:branched-subunit amino acid transport protein